jgi:ribose transport system substrate-binding protein
MRFVGIDGLPQEGQQYVAQGILDATFLYPTGGDVAIEQALKILGGQPVEKRIVLGTRIFTKDNVEQGGTPISQ